MLRTGLRERLQRASLSRVILGKCIRSLDIAHRPSFSGNPWAVATQQQRKQQRKVNDRGDFSLAPRVQLLAGSRPMDLGGWVVLVETQGCDRRARY